MIAQIKSGPNWAWRLNISALVLFLGAVLLFSGVLWAVKTVEVVEGERAITVTTLAFTVEQALKEAGVDLQPEDKVVPTLNSLLEEGMQIRIFRAEEIYLEVDGKQWKVVAASPGLEELLQKERITINPLDKVESNLQDPGAGLKLVKVTRLTEKIIEEKVTVPFKTLNQPDGQMQRGARKVLQAGKAGVALRQVRITQADGEELQREVVGQEMLVKPQQQIVAYGIMDQSRPAARGQIANASKVMTMEATAYTHTGNPTATGIYPYEGLIAVDPRIIPLGSKVYVEGYGYAEAQDTGGLIKGDRIDLFMDTEAKAKQWGRRLVHVYLLDS